MREFAAAGRRREPNEGFWRFYEIVARTRNDPNRMTFAEEADIDEICGSRAIAEDRLGRSRIDRYLDSSGDDPGAKRRARRREAKEEAESLDMLEDVLRTFVDAVPRHEVARLAQARGREAAISSSRRPARQAAARRRLAAPSPRNGGQDHDRRGPRRRASPVLSATPRRAHGDRPLFHPRRRRGRQRRRDQAALSRAGQELPARREPERFQTYRAAFEALHTERDPLAAKLLAQHGGALARLCQSNGRSSALGAARADPSGD